MFPVDSHTVDIGAGIYQGYIWPCIAIWSFDRFVRFARLAYCNYRVRYSESAPRSITSTATYGKDADMIRIEATVGPNFLRPGPGQHYFIYQYNRLRFWENHPFTLAAWYDPNDNISNSQSTTSPVLHKAEQQAAINTGTEKDTRLEQTTAPVTDKDERDVVTAICSPESPSFPSKNPTLLEESDIKGQSPITEGQFKLVFLIRPFNGWTKRIRDQCLKAGPEGLSAKLLVEGPYGEHSPVLSFENVIFIVGGTGIAGAIPYLQEYDRLIKTKSQKVLTRDITVVWSAKQSHIIQDVASRELKPFLNRENIHFKFYATREMKLTTASIVGSKKPNGNDIQISHSRPNIYESIFEVADQVNSAGSRGGRIAIFTCGPAAMADEARLTAHQALKAGKQGLEYIEESFG